MTQAAKRRRKKRRRILAHLAKTNPKAFSEMWSLRVNSWANEAKKRAGRFTDSVGDPVPPAFQVIEIALSELEAIDNISPIVRREAKETEQILATVCCKAVAGEMDRHLYKPIGRLPND